MAAAGLAARRPQVIVARCAAGVAGTRCGHRSAAVRGRRRVVMRRGDRSAAVCGSRRVVMRGRDLAVHLVLRSSPIGGGDGVHVRRMMRGVHRPLGRGDPRVPVIHCGKHAAIARGDSLVSDLRVCRGEAALTRDELCVRRSCVDAAVAAVKRHSRTSSHGPSVDHGPVVRIVNDRPVHVDDRRVVVERAARPESADETGTEVAVAIINFRRRSRRSGPSSRDSKDMRR